MSIRVNPPRKNSARSCKHKQIVRGLDLGGTQKVAKTSRPRKRKLADDDGDLYEDTQPIRPFYMPTEEQAATARIQLDARLDALRQIKREIEDTNKSEVDTLEAARVEMQPQMDAALELRNACLERLKAAEADLGRLEEIQKKRFAEIEKEHRNMVTALQRKHAKIAESAFSQRSVFAPIRRLPLETLSMIFEYFVMDGGSPRDLVFICHSWSQAAFATYSLWSRIKVTDTCHADKAVARLKAALARSGSNTPLDIILECRGTPLSEKGRDARTFYECHSNIPPQFEMIFFEAGRWRSLEIVHFNMDFTKLTSPLPHMSRLQSLALPGEQWLTEDMPLCDLVQHMESTSVSLRKAVIPGNIDRKLIPKLAQLFQNVTQFQCGKYSHDFKLTKDMSSLQEVTKEAEESFYGCGTSISHHNVPTIHIRNININSLLSRTWQNLRTLVIMNGYLISQRGATNTIPKDRCYAPSLKTLSVVGGNHQIVVCFEVPNLDTLELRKPHNPTRFPSVPLEKIWSSPMAVKSGKAPSPRVLKLDLNGSSDSLLTILRRLPLLEELYVKEKCPQAQLSASFFRLMAESFASHKPNSFLSNLQVFVVHTSAARLEDGLNAEFEKLQEVISSSNIPRKLVTCIPSYGWSGTYDAEESLE